MHTDPGVVLHVGANVTIGHRAFLHGCTIGEGSLIANGAMVLDRAVIGRNCVIAAGALVPPDKIIPDGSVVMGSPGKIVREVGERERALIQRSVDNYRQRASVYLTRLTPLR
jgi:carbonic anhydrase/acetyltransferase-like protein (isoleucine patch superfamily)